MGSQRIEVIKQEVKMVSVMDPVRSKQHRNGGESCEIAIVSSSYESIEVIIVVLNIVMIIRTTIVHGI